VAEEQTGQERTEQPTERRLQEARRKGQVPRSRELNTLMVLLSSAAAIWILGGGAVATMADLVTAALTPNKELLTDPEQVPVFFMQIMFAALLLIAPFLLVTLLAALVGPASMGGLVFSAESLVFKLDKLDPIKGLGRIFALKGLVELVKTLLKFGLVLLAAVAIFLTVEREILGLTTMDLQVALSRSAYLLTWALLALSATLILVVSIDVPFELWNHNKQLKMTRQEIRDEMKESDGRPEVKQRVRQLQREASQRRMMQDVPTADVVITNPTHYAVALKYDQSGRGAPRVVAKGKDLVALQIRAIATQHDVVVYEEPPLARALFASTEIGQEIPGALFLAVAKVLAYVFHLRQALPTDYVPKPAPVELPEEFADIMNEDVADGD
jgi:flagellar biosynthetic protein FlhB